MENRYTDSVKNAWKFAAEEASKLGSEYVGTEHLLIGISNEKDSVGGKILNSLGLTVTALEEFLQAYNDSVFFRNTDLYIAPRTKRVLDLAIIMSEQNTYCWPLFMKAADWRSAYWSSSM